MLCVAVREMLCGFLKMRPRIDILAICMYKKNKSTFPCFMTRATKYRFYDMPFILECSFPSFEGGGGKIL